MRANISTRGGCDFVVATHPFSCSSAFVRMRRINRVLTLNRSCRVLVHPEKLLELPGRASFRSIALTHTLRANETIPAGFSRFRASLCILGQTTILLWFIRAGSFVSNSFVSNSHEFVLAPSGSFHENHARSHRFRRAFTRHFH